MLRYTSQYAVWEKTRIGRVDRLRLAVRQEGLEDQPSARLVCSVGR
jgi:hypothetical protein